MFTGIVTDIGTIRSAAQQADMRLVIATTNPLDEVAIGASIACSGVCLTVVEKGADWFAVDLSGESVARTVPGRWQAGQRLNLERALKVGDELGGHIVTGHVDGVGRVAARDIAGGSTRLDIDAPPALAPYIAEKGSITVDGVSLTVNAVADHAEGCRFGLNLIPHTAGVTTLGALIVGDAVHLEIDVLARYLARARSLFERT